MYTLSIPYPLEQTFCSIHLANVVDVFVTIMIITIIPACIAIVTITVTTTIVPLVTYYIIFRASTKNHPLVNYLNFSN